MTGSFSLIKLSAYRIARQSRSVAFLFPFLISFKKHLWSLLRALCLLSSIAITHAAPIKVACVGDSITLGVGVANPALHGYPAVLGKLLGNGCEVRNFGFSGATLLRAGNNPYWKTTAFRDAMRSDPQVVVILLGTNDSKTINWDGREAQFRPDYEALIDRFAKLPSKPRIFLCLPPPSFQRGDDIRERILARERPIIRKIGADRSLPVVDLDALFKQHRDWLPDGVHPSETGAEAIARAVTLALRKQAAL